MKNPNLRENAHTDGMGKYKDLYENAPLPYQSLDADGCFVDVNPAFLKTLGYEREEIIGKFFGDFLDPSSKAHFMKKFAEFKRHGSASKVEFKILHKRGHWLNISFEGNIAYNADGSYKQTCCVFQDITTRLSLNEALLESERRLSTLMSNLPGMAYRCRNDPDWTMEFISMGCMALTGYKPSDLLENKNKAYSELIHPDDRKMVWTTVQKSLARKESFEMEYRIFTARGKQKFVLEMGTGLFVGEQIQYLEGFITDITERKQAQEKILRDQDHLEDLVIERTKDIEAKNKELERFNKLFVGREFRIKELKDRVKELEKRLQDQ